MYIVSHICEGYKRALSPSLISWGFRRLSQEEEFSSDGHPMRTRSFNENILKAYTYEYLYKIKCLKQVASMIILPSWYFARFRSVDERFVLNFISEPSRMLSKSSFLFILQEKRQYVFLFALTDSTSYLEKLN